jgi:hypothetical protein
LVVDGEETVAPDNVVDLVLRLLLDIGMSGHEQEECSDSGGRLRAYVR